MAIALVHDRTHASLSTRPAGSAPPTKDRREFAVTAYLDVLCWPIGEGAEGLVLQLGCLVGAVEFAACRGREVIAVLRPLPPRLNPDGPGRWIAPPADRSLRLPRLRAMLSTAWHTVTV